jgi:AcrR family transcriptional regulator
VVYDGEGAAVTESRVNVAPQQRIRLGEGRQQEIMQAAYDILAEVGYAGLRFDAVAARAKTSKATLYRHWPTKAELVAEAVRCCKGSASKIPDTGSLRGDLFALLRGMADAMAGEDGPLLAGLVMAMRSDPELAAEMRSLTSAKSAMGQEICDRAIARGEMPDGRDPGLIEEIGPPLLFMQSFARGEPLDEPFIEHIVDDILLPLLRG